MTASPIHSSYKSHNISQLFNEFHQLRLGVKGSSDSSECRIESKMPASEGFCNLQRFLDSVTPIIPSKTASRSCMLDEKERVDFFALKDLWDSYEEWSAYGAETRVLMKCGETVKQYHIPYLSAIQIYTAPKPVAPSARNKGEAEGSVEVESESVSDVDSGSGDLSGSLSKASSITWDSVSEDLSSDQGRPWSHKVRFGDICFEYFETSSPNLRMPFTDKMNELVKSHVELNSLTSLDISPASWMAVAWYPIYNIPTTNDRDLSTCFLTYHTLSSTFLDNRDDLSDKVSLSPFGIAIYKMRGDLWVRPETAEYVKFMDLQKAATSWLKQLNVFHHDSSFFASRAT